MKRLAIKPSDTRKKFFSFTLGFFISFFVFVLAIFFVLQKPTRIIQEIGKSVPTIVKTALPTPTPTIKPLPESYIIPLKTHVFQSFNNCGPATLSMALSYVGITKSQAELGQILRPYQVPGGDNDDKSVTLEEIANQASSYGLYAYLRPNGTLETLKRFTANDIVVVTRTWLKTNEDIGHYRVVRGYDDTKSEIIQDDSLQGKDLRYFYDEYLELWKPFNYEYLIIVDKNKKQLAEQILGEELDEKKAWKNALKRIEGEIQNDPTSWHLTFAKSRIYYYLGEYQKSVEEFEKVENSLSFRTLWYQIEPILSYYELKSYNRVFQITENILNNHNRAFSELYLIRGDIYKEQGNLSSALEEYEKAAYYNSNMKIANERLNSL